MWRPVREGSQPRFGDALIAGRPGILIETSTQFGANTLDVTRALEERLDALAPRWPSKAFYTIRRCCGLQASSKAPSRNCATPY